MATRRAQIAFLEDGLLFDEGLDSQVEETVVEDLAEALAGRELIPIIGDAIRLSHIFEVPNVVEQLSEAWARQINYPLKDPYRLARVAQFRRFTENIPDARRAKQAYLDFLKNTLLGRVAKVAQLEDDEALARKIKIERQKLKMDSRRTLGDIADSLGFPRFNNEDRRDPLELLAKLPVKYYLTTSYHDFIERALIKAGKKPQSTMCFWTTVPNVAEEHRYPSQEPDENNPLVYHLFGMEQYAASMVLSEDDYLRFLWRLASSAADRSDGGPRLIPAEFERQVNASMLLLLGYRLEDWDLRMLFHGLLNAERQLKVQRPISVAIQIDPLEQPLVDDDKVDEAGEYLDSYFKTARFQLRCQDSDAFVDELSRAWQARKQGGTL